MTLINTLLGEYVCSSWAVSAINSPNRFYIRLLDNSLLCKQIKRRCAGLFMWGLASRRKCYTSDIGSLDLGKEKAPELLLACGNVFPDTPNYVNTCAYEHSFYVHTHTHTHLLCALMRHASTLPWQRLPPDWPVFCVCVCVFLIGFHWAQQHIIQVNFTVLLTSGWNQVISSTQTADWLYTFCLSLLL